MSRAEVERFAEDLKTKPALLADVKAGNRLDAAVGIAARHGYDFTLDEARTFVAAKAKAAGKELSAGQLDKVAGGASTFCIPCMSPPPFTPGGGKF